MLKTAIIIPARLDSKRLPRKLLREVGGKPVLRWTWEAAKAAKDVDKVLVVTPDREIYDAVISWGGNVAVSERQHECGTLRVIEAARHLGWEFTSVINLQADQVSVKPEWLTRMAYLLRFKAWECPAYTICCDLPESEERDPSVVKVAVSANNTACYFSRLYFPYARKHIGVYGFRRMTLDTISSLPVTTAARKESLEQLSWLGYFDMGILDAGPQISVSIDTEADLDKFAEVLSHEQK